MHHVTKFLVVIGVVGAGICAAIPFRRVEPVAVRGEIPAMAGQDALALQTEATGVAGSAAPEPVALNVSGLSADAPAFSIADQQQEEAATDAVPQLSGNPSVKADRSRHGEFRKFGEPAPPPDLPAKFGSSPKSSSKPVTDGDKTETPSLTPSNAEEVSPPTSEENAPDDRKTAFVARDAVIEKAPAEDVADKSAAAGDEPSDKKGKSTKRTAKTNSKKKSPVERPSGEDLVTKKPAPKKRDGAAPDAEATPATKPPVEKLPAKDEVPKNSAVAETAAVASVAKKPLSEPSAAEGIVAEKPRSKKQRTIRDDPGPEDQVAAEAESTTAEAPAGSKPAADEIRRLALAPEADRGDDSQVPSNSTPQSESRGPGATSETEETVAVVENPAEAAEPLRNAAKSPKNGPPPERPPVVSIPADATAGGGWRPNTPAEAPPPVAVSPPSATSRVAIRSDWRAAGAALAPKAIGDSNPAPRTSTQLPSAYDLVAGKPQYVRHRVVDGDSLASLAQRYLGSRERYLDIFHANRHVLVSPDILPIGVELIVPAAPVAAGPDTPRVNRVNEQPRAAGSVQVPTQPRLVPIPPDAFSRRYR